MTNVAIFGASSAIAEQVARLYAVKGARLFLAARDAERLDAIAFDLRARGAEAVAAFAIDFADVSHFAEMLDRCEAEVGTPDRALIAYGVLGDQRADEGDTAAAAAQLHLNFVSPACLLDALALRMKRGSAIAAITSVAGDRGRQSNYLYGAAKGGLSTYLQGLRHRLAPDGIRVIDVRPGFVNTPMTAHLPKGGPLWAAPRKVAADIVRALEGKDGPVYTPWFWGHIMRVIRHVPTPIFHRTKL
jgi:decaprenylphospho-beta-D-erythro-pentofuranosid-2-ulose 2-reductase